MWRIPITFEILWLLLQARNIRASKAIHGVNLPPVNRYGKMNPQTTDKIVHWFDGMLRLIMKHNKHICFYRSYGLATILRKRGLGVVMNVGGRGLSAKVAQKAHCWLTMDEELFHEQENALALYPFDMGYNQMKSIRYWIGPALDQTLLDQSHIQKNRTTQPVPNRFRDS
jgi:hypothetical protein